MDFMLDTILKGNSPKFIPVKFNCIWPSGLIADFVESSVEDRKNAHEKTNTGQRSILRAIADLWSGEQTTENIAICSM